jgi:hypothetical protein
MSGAWMVMGALGLLVLAVALAGWWTGRIR